MVALLVFIMATLAFLAANKMLDRRGPFGGNVLKNPARCTSATAFRIVHVRAKMVARVPHYDEKLFKLQDRAGARKKPQPRRTHGPLYEIGRMKSSNIISLIKKIKIDSIW